MRVRRIRITSFGAVRDRDYSMGGGMTVLYGPNESGKTSTMEFVRSVLVPSRRRTQYPARSKTDSGTLDVMDDDGSESALELSSKDVKGRRPECVEGMDPDTFREIFAMDPRTLDADDRITSGEIKSRFLTLPGGENMPSAMEWADDSVKASIGLRSNSQSRLRGVEERIARLREGIINQRSRADEYGDMAAELASKEEELKRMSTESERDQSDRDLFKRYESNRGNYERLAELRSRRVALGEFVAVTEEDTDRRGRLTASAESADIRLEELKGQKAEAERGLNGVDRRRVLSHSEEINRLPGRLQQYDRDREELSHATTTQPRPAPAKRSSNRGLVAAGAALVVVGVVLAIAVSYYASLVALAGAVAVVLGLTRGRGTAQPKPTYDGRTEEIRQRVSAFESDVQRLSSELGVRTSDVGTAVATMRRMVEDAASVQRFEMSIMKARMEASEAKTELSGFLSRFGGEQGFDSSLARTREANEIDTAISAITAAIASAGLDPDKPECPVAWEESGMQKEMQDLSGEIAALKARMESILDMKGLESDMDRLQELETERRRILKDGAVAVLSKEIAERACSAAYGGVQPDVVRSADRYLRSMTGSRYSMAVDPETNDISVTSEDGTKGMSEWSSGLRAQVLLSLKLAIAREMGDGKVPVILDDVLLPFDSERKGGALRALSDISNDMQVMLFTCDAETRDLASLIGGVTVMNM